jgi:DNA-directed RNA polymerase subunit RPC12/RpoP
MSDNDDPKHDDKEKPKVDLIVCRHCSFENDPINAYCLNCDRKMPAKRIPKKSAKPPRAARMTGMTYICPECGNFVRFDYTTGETDPCMVC